MGTTYTKAEILTKVNEWLTPQKILMLYAQDFVNYTGITADTKEKYTEVIAEHLLDRLSAFEKSKRSHGEAVTIPVMSQRKSTLPPRVQKNRLHAACWGIHAIT